MDPKIEIEFEKASKTYIPSEEVEGRVMIFPNGTEVAMKEIVIRLEGKRIAFVSAEKSEEFYLCENQLVLLSNDEILPSDGMLEYSFKFNLPSELPASFRVSRASVEYQLSVILKRKSDFDLSAKSTFYVNGILTLEENESSSCQVEIRQSKTAGCFSCFNWRNGNRFGFTGKLLKSQYLPGEAIDFALDVWNCSKSALDCVKISLVRELRILDSGNYHTVLKEYGLLSEIQGPVVAPGEKTTWSSFSSSDSNQEEEIRPLLKIPEDTPPSHLGCKKYIYLNYYVKIEATPKEFCSTALHGKIPIIIGTSKKLLAN